MDACVRGGGVTAHIPLAAAVDRVEQRCLQVAQNSNLPAASLSLSMIAYVNRRRQFLHAPLQSIADWSTVRTIVHCSFYTRAVATLHRSFEKLTQHPLVSWLNSLNTAMVS